MISFLRVLVLAATSCWSVAGYRNELKLKGISDFKYVSWPKDDANSGKITQGQHFGSPRITTRDDGEFIVKTTDAEEPQEGSKEVFNWFMDGLESDQVIIPKKVGSDFEKLKMNFAVQGTMTFNIRKDSFTFPISCPPMRIGQVHTHGRNVWLVGGTNCINDPGKRPNTQILDCKCGDAGQVVTFAYEYADNSVGVIDNRLDIKLVTNACSIFKEVGGYWRQELTIPGSELLEVTSDALEVLTSQEMEKIHEVGIGVESSVSVDYMGADSASYSYAQRKAIANSWKTSTTNTKSHNVLCHEGFWVYRWVSTVTPLSSQCKVKEGFKLRAYEGAATLKVPGLTYYLLRFLQSRSSRWRLLAVLNFFRFVQRRRLLVALGAGLTTELDEGKGSSFIGRGREPWLSKPKVDQQLKRIQQVQFLDGSPSKLRSCAWSSSGSYIQRIGSYGDVAAQIPHPTFGDRVKPLVERDGQVINIFSLPNAASIIATSMPLCGGWRCSHPAGDVRR
eukprot:symbB.v1.2.037372.t1/scaffold5501.1/size35064/2